MTLPASQFSKRAGRLGAAKQLWFLGGARKAAESIKS